MVPIWTVTVHATEMAMDIFANCICLGLIGLLALARAMQKGGHRWR